jgi:uncharacterized membrane protein (UPF0127 family)
MVIHKNFGIVTIIGGVLLVIIVTFIIFILPNMMQPTTYLQLGDGVFRAKLATNETDRTNGLSGVTKLDSDQALLMVFPDQEKWEIGIKNIQIPVDIVWLNSGKKVIYIVKNVLPEDSASDSFSPKLSAKYVVELPAGTVDGKAISTNTTAVFQTNDQGI